MKSSAVPRSYHMNEDPGPWWLALLLPAYLIICVPYFFWRVEIMRAEYAWMLVPLLLADVFSALTTTLHLHLTRRVMHPRWTPPLKGRTVDAFIPTYNEPPDIVEMTAIGALAIRGIRNVFILDDGARNEIREMAARHGAIWLARQDNAHAKAGNMNFGLHHSDAEFLIFLDCDHVPQPNFIHRTLGYFRDPTLAFVQAPQVFYNFRNSIQFRRLPWRNLWHEQSTFYEVVQPAKNRFNAAFFCGSGAIFRRAALDSIGGFATSTATEDIHTSLRLHAAGWTSRFISERLAYGLAPEDFKEYHDQRVRWGAGSLGLLFRTTDSPLIKRGLSLGQRLCYLSSTNYYFYGGVVRSLYLGLPILVMFLAPLLPASDQSYLFAYLSVAFPFYLISIAVAYLQSRKTFHPIYSEQFNLAVVPACLSALVGIVDVNRKLKVAIKRKAARENPLAYDGLIVLALVMGAANLFLTGYWIVDLDMSVSRAVSSVAVSAMFWNTVNLAFVVSLVRYLREFSSRPAALHAFHPHDSSVMLDSGEYGRLASISFRGATVHLNAFPRHSRIRMRLETRQGPVMIMGDAERRSDGGDAKAVAVTFQPLSASQKTLLTRFFFEEVVQHQFDHDALHAARKSASGPLWRIFRRPPITDVPGPGPEGDPSSAQSTLE